jgi:hypothetical protein
MVELVNPFKYLQAWCREHVKATAYEDDAGAEHLASECLRDAKKAGVSEAAVTRAAGGNLASFMRSELDSAADKEVDRLASKKD